MTAKPIVVGLLAVLLPACSSAEELTITVDAAGALSVRGKGLERTEWIEALKAEAQKAAAGRIATPQVTISFVAGTPWPAVRGCCADAAAEGVWDITLSMGEQTLPCPLPRDRGLGAASPDEGARVRVYLSRGLAGETQLLVDGKIRGEIRAEHVDNAAAAVEARLAELKKQGTASELVFGADDRILMRDVMAALLALRSKALPGVLFAAEPAAAGKGRGERLRFIEELVCSGSERYNASTEKERSDAEARLHEATESFARDFAPANGALVACDVKRHVMVLAGGKGTRDGVTVVISGKYLYGEFFLRGGDGGAKGRAGRIAHFGNGRLSSESPPNAAGTDGERGPGLGWATGGAHARYRTGENGPEAEAGDATDFPEEESVRKIADAVEALEKAWGEATDPAAREKLVAKHLLGLRPPRGVVAAWSESRRVVAVLGASGNERNVDGLTVEVFGKPAEVVIAIAGDAGPGGKPGKATAGKGAFSFDGK